MMHVVSEQNMNLMKRASKQNIFKILAHSKNIAGRKGRGSDNEK